MAIENGTTVWFKQAWLSDEQVGQKTQSQVSQKSSSSFECVAHLGTKSRRCRLIKSINWFIMKLGGNACIPPRGTGIVSRQIGQRNEPVLTDWGNSAIRSKQCVQTVWEQFNNFGRCNSVSYGYKHVAQVKNDSLKSSKFKLIVSTTVDDAVDDEDISIID